MEVGRPPRGSDGAGGEHQRGREGRPESGVQGQVEWVREGTAAGNASQARLTGGLMGEGGLPPTPAAGEAKRRESQVRRVSVRWSG